jgi:hypothetical protein
MDRYPYSFEEFCEHADHFEASRPPQSPDGDFVFEKMVLHVHKYMKDLYPDPRECQYKMGRLILMMQYIAEHIQEFDEGDFAVNGSPRVGALVSKHLMQAVDQIFSTDDFTQLRGDPSVDEVKRLAIEIRDGVMPS